MKKREICPAELEEIKTYCTAELEGVFGATKELLDKKCRDGTIPAFKMGREWRIEKSNLISFLRNSRGEV